MAGSAFKAPFGFSYEAGGRYFDNVGGALEHQADLDDHRQREMLEFEAGLETQQMRERLGLLQGLLGNFGFGGQGGGGFGIQQPGFRDAPNPFTEGIQNIESSRRAEIGQGVQDTLNTSLARLEDRGFGGSSLANNAAMGAERTEQQLLSDLAGDVGALQIRGQEALLGASERAQQQRMNLMMSLLGAAF